MRDAKVILRIDTELPLRSLGYVVAPGSLADYMGEAPGSIVTGVIDLTPYIGYIDIYYNYYLNQQYDLVPTSLAGTVSDSAMEYPYYLTASELERVRKLDRKSTRLNSSHITRSRMPSSA